jgi:ATP synthase I chain
METESDYAAIERRLEYFLLGAGAAMTAGAAIGWGARAGVGAAAGTAICWLNFRWLRQGAAALVQLGLAQAGLGQVRVPKTVHAKFLGRTLLLLVAAYAMLVWLHLPAIAVLCGLVAVVPAILLEIGYEVMHGQHRWNAQ